MATKICGHPSFVVIIRTLSKIKNRQYIRCLQFYFQSAFGWKKVVDHFERTIKMIKSTPNEAKLKRPSTEGCPMAWGKYYLKKMNVIRKIIAIQLSTVDSMNNKMCNK